MLSLNPIVKQGEKRAEQGGGLRPAQEKNRGSRGSWLTFPWEPGPRCSKLVQPAARPWPHTVDPPTQLSISRQVRSPHGGGGRSPRHPPLCRLPRASGHGPRSLLGAGEEGLCPQQVTSWRWRVAAIQAAKRTWELIPLCSIRSRSPPGGAHRAPCRWLRTAAGAKRPHQTRPPRRDGGPHRPVGGPATLYAHGQIRRSRHDDRLRCACWRKQGTPIGPLRILTWPWASASALQWPGARCDARSAAGSRSLIWCAVASLRWL